MRVVFQGSKEGTVIRDGEEGLSLRLTDPIHKRHGLRRGTRTSTHLSTCKNRGCKHVTKLSPDVVGCRHGVGQRQVPLPPYWAHRAMRGRAGAVPQASIRASSEQHDRPAPASSSL